MKALSSYFIRKKTIRGVLTWSGVIVILLSINLSCAWEDWFRSDQKVLSEPSRFIPQRKPYALTAQQIIKRARTMSVKKREEFFYQQIISGNIPDFLRILKPVPVRFSLNGQQYQGTIWVMPDYLSVGSNEDFLRVMLQPHTAMKIAKRFHCLLPTTKMVDDIYQAAEVKLKPRPLPPTSQMTTVDYLWRHHRLISEQLQGYSWSWRSKLIAGHKKDIVLTRRLLLNRHRVAIYGWHRLNGRPIQPLSLVHGQNYADYSHGVRLVWQTMEINKKSYAIKNILQDPFWSKLLSYEGPLQTHELDHLYVLRFGHLSKYVF